MKKTASSKNPSRLILSLAIVLLLIGLLAAIFLPQVAEGILTDRLSRITGLSVNIQKLHFSLTHPQFLIKGIRFSNPKGFPLAELANIAEVKVQYVPPPLILGRMDIKKVEVNFKELRLVRDKAGNINLPVQPPVQAAGDVIDELVLNLNSLTYTDLFGEKPIQKTFKVGLDKAVYRNVKGIAGILEIVSWEVLKRTGVEAGEKSQTPVPSPEPPKLPKPAEPIAVEPSKPTPPALAPSAVNPPAKSEEPKKAS